MTNIQEKFFQLVRLGIGASDAVPHISGDEWREIYRMAKKQSLLGVVFDGVQKMSDAAKEQGESVGMDVELLMSWMGEYKQIERRNMQLNVAVGKVSGWFREKGFRSCTLKGQGNALLYPYPLHRTPGDIDIWVSGKPSEVIRFVRSVAPNEKASYHHIDFPNVDGIPVEVHYRPCYLLNPWHNRRLQRFFADKAEEQFSHMVEIDGSSVAVPTAAFNVVYQLVHIYNHLFQEGIGLRQVIDYYLLIQNAEFIIHNSDLRRKLKQLGLWKFAGAMMYVLHEVLWLDESNMIAPMDEKRGRLLQDGILEGGNFGQFSNRQHYGRGTVEHNIQRICRDLQLVKYYPAEALAEPFFRAWHFFWRMKNKK